MPIYNAMEKISDKIRSQYPDVTGRPTYINANEKVEFHYTSLDGKTDLNHLANLLTEELSKDSLIVESGVKVIRDDKHPSAYGHGVIVVSLVK